MSVELWMKIVLDGNFFIGGRNHLKPLKSICGRNLSWMRITSNHLNSNFLRKFPYKINNNKYVDRNDYSVYSYSGQKLH